MNLYHGTNKPFERIELGNNDLMTTSRQEGLAEGEEKGFKRGVAEGVASGKRDIALKMKQAGLSVEQIQAFTGLSTEEISTL